VGVPVRGATLAGHNEGSKEHKNIKEYVVQNLESGQRDVEAIEGPQSTTGDVGKQKRRANERDPQAATRKRKEAEAGDEGRALRQGRVKKGKTSTGEAMATRSRQAPNKTPAAQPSPTATSGKGKTGLRQAPSVELPDKKQALDRRLTKRKDREAQDKYLEGQRAPARKKAMKQKERGGGAESSEGQKAGDNTEHPKGGTKDKAQKRGGGEQKERARKGGDGRMGK
jgi:hypothetical protein